MFHISLVTCRCSEDWLKHLPQKHVKLSRNSTRNYSRPRTHPHSARPRSKLSSSCSLTISAKKCKLLEYFLRSAERPGKNFHGHRDKHTKTHFDLEAK